MQQIRWLAIFLGLQIGVLSSAYAAQEYTLGVVPQFDSRKIAKIWQPIIKQIEQVSGIKLKLVGAPSIPAFEKSFSNGEYDVAYMNPYHALVAHQEQQYQPIIRDVGRKLYGIIVVRKDSPITTVKDLQGKTIAFPSPNALGAALIPRTEFATKFNITVKPKYVKSHGSVYLNVLLGQTQAGGGVKKTFDRQSAEIKDQLRILYKTTKVAPHPLVVHPRVSAADVEKLKHAILAIGKTKNGQAMLVKVPFKKAGQASLNDYLPLKEMGLDKFYIK